MRSPAIARSPVNQEPGSVDDAPSGNDDVERRRRLGQREERGESISWTRMLAVRHDDRHPSLRPERDGTDRSGSPARREVRRGEGDADEARR
jgi:hypothetical protein